MFYLFALPTPPKTKFLGHFTPALLLSFHCHHLHACIWSFRNFSSSLRLFVIKISLIVCSLAFKKSFLNNYILFLRHSTIPWNVTVTKLCAHCLFFCILCLLLFQDVFDFQLVRVLPGLSPSSVVKEAFFSWSAASSHQFVDGSLPSHVQGPQEKPASLSVGNLSVWKPRRLSLYLRSSDVSLGCV